MVSKSLAYFKKLEDLIIDIFDNEDFENQPHGFVDIGCGTGMALEVAFKALTKTKRWQNLEKYPFHLAGVDLSPVSVNATQERLTELTADAPEGFHWVVSEGDFNNRPGIKNALAEQEFDLDKLLPFFGFVLHNRKFKYPEGYVPGTIGDATTTGVGVGPDGEYIPPDVRAENLTYADC